MNWDISFGLAQNVEKVQNEVLFHAQEPSKIVDLDQHPSKGGVFATAHFDGRVCIWNYTSKTAAVRFSLGYWAEQSGRKAGDIRKIRFYDHHAVEWKERLWDAGSGGDQKKKEDAQHDDAQFPSWLIIMADSHIVFFDYMTLATRELPLSALDGRAASNVELTAYPHILAFGGSDGQVRLFDTVKWKRVERLQCTASKPVLLLVAYKDESNKDCIVAANEDGKLYTWEWEYDAIDSPPETTESKKGAVKTIPSQTPKKAHDSFVSCTYNPYQRELITLGSDKSWMVYNIVEQSETLRCRSANKAWVHAHSFVHPRFANYSLLVGGKGDSKLYVTSPDSAAPQKEILDVAPLCTSKEIHIRRLAVDHTKGNKILCLTKSDIFVIAVEPLSAPGFAMAALGKSQEISAHCLTSATTLQTLELDNSLVKDVQLKITDGTDVSSSATGRYVTVYSREAYRYYIYDTKNWKSITDGTAKSFAWYSTDSDRFAILDIVLPKVEEDPKKKRPLQLFASKKKEAPVLQTVLKLFNMSSGSPEEVDFRAPLPEGEARELFPGPTLGIGVTEKAAAPLTTSTTSAGPTEIPLNAIPTHFLLWREDDKGTPPLIPAPRLVVWDRSSTPKANSPTYIPMVLS